MKIPIDVLINNLEEYSYNNVFGDDCFVHRKQAIIDTIESGTKPEDIDPIRLVYCRSTHLFQIQDGTSRTRAFRELGIKEINCEITKTNISGFSAPCKQKNTL